VHRSASICSSVQRTFIHWNACYLLPINVCVSESACAQAHAYVRVYVLECVCVCACVCVCVCVRKLTLSVPGFTLLGGIVAAVSWNSSQALMREGTLGLPLVCLSSCMYSSSLSSGRFRPWCSSFWAISMPAAGSAASPASPMYLSIPANILVARPMWSAFILSSDVGMGSCGACQCICKCARLVCSIRLCKQIPRFGKGAFDAFE